MKTCNKCKLPLDNDSFSNKPNNKDGLNGSCKQCIKNNRSPKKEQEYRKRAYLKHTNEKKDQNKLFREQHPNYMKEYRKKNRSRINRYHKEKLQSDKAYKIKQSISSRVLCELKKLHSSKCNKSTFSVLPYTIGELYKHIQSLFEPWMNWDNWGAYRPDEWDDNNSSTWRWNIDHIIPASRFRYQSMADEEFKKCWGLDNIRPLSAKQNVADGNRRL